MRAENKRALERVGLSLSEASLHDRLKYWLIELGNSLGYESYSGDSEPLTVQLGKWHDSYQPDVVWRYRGEICVFEIVFTEKWRAVVGEICLASMVEDCIKIFIVHPSSKYPAASEAYEYRRGTYYSMIGKKVGLKHGAKAIFFPYDALEKKRIEEIKSLVLKQLERLEWKRVPSV